jgi:hypothetical protein
MNDCEFCDGPVGVLGILGNLVHGICRDCGAAWSRDAKDFDPEVLNEIKHQLNGCPDEE